MTSVYSATHFLVDFSCAFLMFRSIAGTPYGYLCVMLYNFCAFAMQMPLGIIADKWNRNYLFAIIGCILIGLAYGLIFIPVTAVLVVGIGNAMFHLGGGIDVLNISGEKLGALGVFVSPGALGVYFGTMLGKGGVLSSFLIPPALVAAAALILVLHRAQKGRYPKNTVFSPESLASPRLLVAVICLFLVVCLRSFVGLALDFPWKSAGYWGTALVCAVVFGKIVGGFAANHFGLYKTSIFSLGLAAVFFLFPAVPSLSLAAVLILNMTMPITLWAMAKIIPGAKGFSFGLLTFGLFLGFLPVYLGTRVPMNASLLFAILAAVSLAILVAGLRRAKL